MQDQSVTTLTARVFDSTRRSRWLVAAGASVFAGGLALFLAGAWGGLVAAALGLTTIFGWIARTRRRPRERRVVCKPGSIHAGNGLIRARDLEGATTARVNDRIARVLAPKRRRHQPIILELADESALAAVSKSLGIGHHGFGHIQFSTQPTQAETVMRVLSAIAAFAVVGLFFESALPFAILTLVFAACALGLTVLVAQTFPPPFASILSGGVYLPTGLFVPFDVIEDVRLTPYAIAFRVRADHGSHELALPVRFATHARHGPTIEELEHIVAQIRAAVDRAHGRFTLKSAPEALAAQLARGKGESDADWHARLDTLGVGAAGYRALSAEPAELWALLEDPEAPADVRSGAARVLRRIDKNALKVRVAAVLAAVRDDETRARIADSIDEGDESPADPQSAAHS